MIDLKRALGLPIAVALSMTAGQQAQAQTQQPAATGACGQPAALNAGSLSIDAQPTQVVGAFVQLQRNEPRYVELTIGAPVDLTLGTDTSQADTTLVLFDSKGAVIGSDDDGGGDTNSRLVASLEPGAYCLQVDQIGALDAPSAVVPVSIVGAPPPDACILQADAPVAMTEDEIVSSGQLNGKTRMAITAPAGTGLRIEASSPIFDTYLSVEDKVGRILGEDDDSGGDTNSKLELPAANAEMTYCITLSGLEDKGGLYALAISPIKAE